MNTTATKFDRIAILNAIIARYERSEEEVEEAKRVLHGGRYYVRVGFINDMTSEDIDCDDDVEKLAALRVLLDDATFSRALRLHNLACHGVAAYDLGYRLKFRALERQVRAEMEAEVKALRDRASRLAKALRA